MPVTANRGVHADYSGMGFRAVSDVRCLAGVHSGSSPLVGSIVTVTEMDV